MRSLGFADANSLNQIDEGMLLCNPLFFPGGIPRIGSQSIG
jgi:hypothetical protein